MATWWYSGNPLTTRIDWRPGSSFIAPPARLMVTVYQDGLRDGQTRHSELVQEAEMLWRIGHDVLVSGALSGTVLDRNGVAAGVWTYHPTAVN